MEDIGKKLYELISAEFERSLKKLDLSPKTLSEVSAYSAELGRLLRRCIEKYVTEETLPDRRLYYNIAKSILEPALRRNYQLINAAADEAQKAADTLLGIHLNPLHPDFPEERVRNVIGAASQQGIEIETAVRRLASPAENITQSFSDDYMQENAEFRSRAGLGVRIERTTDGSCCKWCSSKAGTYRYPDQTPKDIFRRHDNCGCLVEYITEKGRQNVWSKEWRQDKERAERIKYAESVPKPTKHTPEQAKALERRLTEEQNRGIIKSIDVDDYATVTYGKGISQDVSDVIFNTMKRCEKDGGYIISEISTTVIPTSDGIAVLQIEPMANGLLKLNINADYLSGKTLEEINKAFFDTDSNLARTLEEAAWHESGHAISIKGKSISEIEALYKELEKLGQPGISEIALNDGAECLAELEILRHRGEDVSKELKEFYKKYMRRNF